MSGTTVILERQPPLVSIGLPVFNGENFIALAIHSVLTQTHENWELIICDNASTDRTESICREAAATDNRIRYLRNEHNIGAAPNFNRIVGEARGVFFKWLAHDDLILPRFLAACAELLQADSRAALACSHVRFIDQDGQPIEDYRTPFRTDDPNPAVRFNETLYRHPCYEIFGLIRREILDRTRLIAPYKHGDGVLLSHLALFGRFAQVDEVLFLSRRHQGQSMYVYGVTNPRIKSDPVGYAQWFDPANRKAANLNFNRRLLDYFRIALRTPLSVRDRLAVHGHLLRWAFRSRYQIRREWFQALGRSSSQPRLSK